MTEDNFNVLTAAELAVVKKAKEVLEHPNLAIRLTNLLGKPLQLGFDKLPDNWRNKIGQFTEESLTKVMSEVILPTLAPQKRAEPSNWLHKTLATMSGIAGGAWGFPGLAFELPISTAIFLRSIMDIARAHGMDLQSPQTILECYSVFAIAGPGKDDDTTNEIYYVIRASLAKVVEEASAYLAAQKAAQKGASAAVPEMIRLITTVASRYGIVMSNKAAAQAVPVAGAVTGGLLNYFFIDYFQEIAEAHFMLLELEHRYGKEPVQLAYRNA